MNENTIDEVVTAIAAASRTLNQAAEEATRIIEQLDAKLVDAEPGVSVWGPVLLTEKKKSVQRKVTLGFSKVKKKKWGLCIKEELKGSQGAVEEELTLLRKADRNLRLLAVPHLDGLTNTILSTLFDAAKEVEHLLPKVEEEELPPEGEAPAAEPGEAAAE